MLELYKIFGSEMSPYSVKVRSYFRLKGIPHEWIARSAANDEAYRLVARLPIVPTVVLPDGKGLQDSTPIIETVEETWPDPTIHPEDTTLAFLSALIEEFGDEWANKLMFHHRWHAEIDKLASAQTLAYLSLPDGSASEIADRAAFILERMSGRGHFVGSSAANAPLITAYYLELLDVLQAHLSARTYLFGARPSFGDLGLAGQLYEASVDPTCGAAMRGRAPAVLDWCHRMLEPRVDGDFEGWESLRPTLQPLIAYIGRYFLPWSVANAAALEAGEAEFTVALPGGDYAQSPQKYHARSLAALRARFGALPHLPVLDAILDEANCRRFLT